MLAFVPFLRYATTVFGGSRSRPCAACARALSRSVLRKNRSRGPAVSGSGGPMNCAEPKGHEHNDGGGGDSSPIPPKRILFFCCVVFFLDDSFDRSIDSDAMGGYEYQVRRFLDGLIPSSPTRLRFSPLPAFSSGHRHHQQSVVVAIQHAKNGLFSKSIPSHRIASHPHPHRIASHRICNLPPSRVVVRYLFETRVFV